MSTKVGGYDLDEVDSVSSLVFQLMSDEQVPNKLAIVALCRAITMMGDDHDLDMACTWIDRFAEIIEAEKEALTAELNEVLDGEEEEDTDETH